MVGTRIKRFAPADVRQQTLGWVLSMREVTLIQVPILRQATTGPSKVTNPITCRCGGRRPAYSSKRTTRFVTQYRRCESCGELSKTRRWIQQERKLSPEEITSLALNGNDSQTYEFFIVARPR